MFFYVYFTTTTTKGSTSRLIRFNIFRNVLEGKVP